ncbi:hypothetical protein GCM10027037_08640 [Mucilaginibacter koreensis]
MKAARSSLWLFLLLTGLSVMASAQKVANFAFKKYGRPGYETYGFVADHNRRTTIDYTYGNSGSPIALTYAGTTIYKGKKYFKVIFPDHSMRLFAPVGNQLQVVDPVKKTSKTLAWEYQGPVNGVGTFCEACAENEKEAMRIVKRYYWK